jgi:hypothetical protein
MFQQMISPSTLIWMLKHLCNKKQTVDDGGAAMAQNIFKRAWLAVKFAVPVSSSSQRLSWSRR